MKDIELKNTKSRRKYDKYKNDIYYEYFDILIIYKIDMSN